ncbi:MAG: hypothetical protein AAGB01_02585, partial [Cyanobacteria bacterium P01_F01_bin.42]
MIKHSTSWRGNLALLITLGLGTAPVLPVFFAPPVSAQLFGTSRTFRIVRGTVIPAAYEDGETTKIVVTPDESLERKHTTTPK